MQPDKISLKGIIVYMSKAILLGIVIFLFTWDFHTKNKTQFNETEKPQFQRIDLVRMLSEITKNPDKVVILDTRFKEYYQRSRIPKAIWVEDTKNVSSAENVAQRYKSSKEIEYVIVYGNRSDPTAELFAIRLFETGLEKVQLFYPGFEQWSICGLPTTNDEGQ